MKKRTTPFTGRRNWTFSCINNGLKKAVLQIKTKRAVWFQVKTRRLRISDLLCQQNLELVVAEWILWEESGDTSSLNGSVRSNKPSVDTPVDVHRQSLDSPVAERSHDNSKVLAVWERGTTVWTILERVDEC